MWSRADLKRKARTAIKKNYLACMLAALILLFTTGSQVTDKKELVQDASDSYYASVALQEGDIQESEYLELMEKEEAERNVYDRARELTGNPEFVFLKRVAMGPMQVIWDNIVWMLGSMAAVVMLLLGIFAFNPIEVGGCRFFTENAESSGAYLPKVQKLFFVFRDKNYRNVVLTMFLKNLKIVLWSLLFIIPGVIKAYEYQMVPYLLAEHPDLNRREALEKSAEMMYGQKWQAFLLDLSFILWDFLGVITFGLVSIFFVNPYVHATNAELYLFLKNERRGKGEREEC